ncbi:kinase-like domain-containing protein [Microdochium trichocladiopsis]|uniref:cyclin-dependent kinase n=1 Tax=Microdochium trichocladiopsis TaxID=1682393 RepID=A0A9P9BPA5_9PEZI|nr:kinase-like domain-containing protein [Microdochium trichocladiopsis]KAH7032934.1 kinase-like domain-containing protein [Microdochium trichocladiopsis]
MNAGPPLARDDDGASALRGENEVGGAETQASVENRAQPPASSPATSTSNSKFSFAFKATSKAPVTAPKLEISQKLSAPAKKEQPPSLADERYRERDQGRLHERERERDRYRDRERERDRDRERERERERFRERESDRAVDRSRDIPRDAPRGPASSRPQPPLQPERPRTRMVKKIERRLKPKPQLPEDLRTSWSIFFRKQGNESVIGSGTYGKVYKGVHVYTKKLVALKKIRMEGERDGFPVTAIREIKLLQSLKHKNIVDLQEVMIEKNDCYMVFEYLSHDLTGLLNHPSYTLDPAQRKHLAMQLFEGLDYLHQRGVLHRDIKAANILVSSSGILKFADFGLARFYAKRHQYDYTNRVVTIWYRSPELLLGETQYGAAVDIWSAACVMVEIFTRHAIFPGDGSEINQLDTIYAVLGTPNKQEWPNLPEMPWFELLRPGYRRPSAFVEKYQEKLPAAAFDLLSQMFQYDPAKRPSAAEVLQHAYFTTELPKARQAIELENIQGDWHELESKALRREKERQDREARKAAAAAKDAANSIASAGNMPSKHKERKRPPDGHDAQREPKRHHVQQQLSGNGGAPAAGAAEEGLASAI